MRLLLEASPRVAEALRTHFALAPDLIAYEVANTLATALRNRTVPPANARRALDGLFALPIQLVPAEALAAAAVAVAATTQLSAYDAAYVALAGQRDAVLFTADRRLARVAPRSELVE